MYAKRKLFMRPFFYSPPAANKGIATSRADGITINSSPLSAFVPADGILLNFLL